MKYFFSLMVICASLYINAQELNGQQLLNKAIKTHDPNRNWNSFQGGFQITMTTPSQPERVSDITINLPEESFEVNAVRDSILTSYYVVKEVGAAFKSDLRQVEKVIMTTEKDAERALFMKNYYTYLYGLPMKLKDEGTNIDNKIERKTFKGKEYLVLKATYDQNVGSDAWFFYFDPTTYKMEIYQFFKTDASGKIKPHTGEYIVLSGNQVVNDIHMPKVRKWYYNKDDQFLGTDVITK
jgi:hypothetical protein